MYYIYLLKLNDNNKKYYIGSTPDISKRVSEHSSGRSKFTSIRLPIELIYFEAYNSKELAIQREKKLKQFGSAYIGLLKRLNLK